MKKIKLVLLLIVITFCYFSISKAEELSRGIREIKDFMESSGFTYVEGSPWMAPYELEANDMRGDCKAGAIYLQYWLVKNGFRAALITGEIPSPDYYGRNKFRFRHLWNKIIIHGDDGLEVWEADITNKMVWKSYDRIDFDEETLQEIQKVKDRQNKWEKEHEVEWEKSQKENKEHYDVHKNGTLKGGTK